MIFVLCTSVAVIYAGILGDLATFLLKNYWYTTTAAAPTNLRSISISVISALFLLPMGLIRDLSGLAFTSFLGSAAIAYTVLFVLIRAVDGTYRLPEGHFVSEASSQILPYMPTFHRYSWWNINFSSLVLASNLGLAYIAHYNGPSFYRNLKDTNAKRFSNMVNFSFAILVALYGLTMTAGYTTFGDACQGNLLLNYHPHDVLSTLGRFATLISILFGFPLVFAGARESLIGALSSVGYSSVSNHHTVTVLTLLAGITVIACTIKDVSLVVGLTGAVMGSFIVYICPALLYTRSVRLAKGKNSPEDVQARKWIALVPFGALLALFGAFVTITQS